MEPSTLLDSGAVGPYVTDGVGCGDDAVDGEAERVIVAQWLRAHADQVRVLEVESTQGLASPARRIPTLVELCGGLDRAGTGPAVGSSAGPAVGQAVGPAA